MHTNITTIIKKNNEDNNHFSLRIKKNEQHKMTIQLNRILNYNAELSTEHQNNNIL